MIGQTDIEASHEALFKRWLEQHAGLVFKLAGTFAPYDVDRDDLVQEKRRGPESA